MNYYIHTIILTATLNNEYVDIEQSIISDSSCTIFKSNVEGLHITNTTCTQISKAEFEVASKYLTVHKQTPVVFDYRYNEM